jgi:hypothetical protein
VSEGSSRKEARLRTESADSVASVFTRSTLAPVDVFFDTHNVHAVMVAELVAMSLYR